MKFAGRDIDVKVLTVAQIKEVMEELDELKKPGAMFDIVDLLMDDEIPAVAVSKATGLSLAELGGEVVPQELSELFQEVRAKNPFYLGMMERLISGAKGALEKDDSPAQKS